MNFIVKPECSRSFSVYEPNAEGLHHWLEYLSNSTTAHAYYKERWSGTLHQKLKDGLHVINSNMQVRRRRIKSGQQHFG